MNRARLLQEAARIDELGTAPRRDVPTHSSIDPPDSAPDAAAVQNNAAASAAAAAAPQAPPAGTPLLDALLPRAADRPMIEWSASFYVPRIKRQVVLDNLVERELRARAGDHVNAATVEAACAAATSSEKALYAGHSSRLTYMAAARAILRTEALRDEHRGGDDGSRGPGPQHEETAAEAASESAADAASAAPPALGLHTAEYGCTCELVFRQAMAWRMRGEPA